MRPSLVQVPKPKRNPQGAMGISTRTTWPRPPRSASCPDRVRWTRTLTLPGTHSSATSLKTRPRMAHPPAPRTSVLPLRRRHPSPQRCLPPRL
ncbi:hypothetical protein C8Q80DRAFT_1210840 [Daedaleopsis nitida]|nr:hypothetical protein C8Q80DRAFT_1210840 [Daedaleopsis nitida]